jgi:rhodanese-related sulfurtransferase
LRVELLVKPANFARADPENVRIDPSWPRDRFTVVYSADLHVATSARAAEALIATGFREVLGLRGGFQAWEAARGPVEGK